MNYDFTQDLYLGFAPKPWPASISKQLVISTAAFEAAGDYAGSSHILEMGRHFDAYVAYDSEAPKFGSLSGFPSNLFFEQLLVKARSAGVTGNIGETITGIVATETFGCDAAQIAHLVVRSKQKTPDFLMHKTNSLESVLKSVTTTPTLSLPEWWLVESKIRSGEIDKSAITEGLVQLATIWFDMKDELKQDVGYGIVIGTGLYPKREMRIHLFMPPNETSRLQLLTYLNALPSKPKFDSAVLKRMCTYLA